MERIRRPARPRVCRTQPIAEIPARKKIAGLQLDPGAELDHGVARDAEVVDRALTAPTYAATGGPETPAQYEANSLTPAKVSAMIGCGVNLFGFDQILPDASEKALGAGGIV